ncbi:MAG: FAD-binding oxidoreductase [Clostridiales Family XIII bacterium]|jgi:FAD/FMN-containing dehydrogenase|nr:FAD-binding oxidoreductase [Clostridiales Family XIII bacterium]
MNVAAELSKIVGSDNFTDDPVLLQAYRDTLYPVDVPMPFGVALPQSADQVQAIVKLCGETELPITPIAVGAPLNGPTLCAPGGLILDFCLMNKIISIDPDELVAVIEPGVTIGQMVKALEPYKLMAQYPNSSPLTSVLASMVMMRGVGQYATKYGLGDSFVNGVEAILGTGEKIVTGSAALEGADWHYRHCFGPDLTGIFIGSLGTMGLVTKAAIRLSPIPESTWGLALGFDAIEDAMAPISHIAKYQMADYINGQHWYAGATTGDDYPWEVTGGKAPLPDEYMREWRKRKGLPNIWFHMAIGGSPAEIEVRKKQLLDYLSSRNITPMDMSNDPWFQVRNVQLQGVINCSSARFCRHRGGGWVSLVMLAPIKKWGEILEPLVEKGKTLGFDPTYLLKVYGPYGHSSQCRFVVSFDKGSPDERARAFAFTETVAKHAVEKGANVHRQTMHPEIIQSRQPEYFALLKLIKSLVDPKCILNPGVLNLSKETLAYRQGGEAEDAG